MSEIVPLSIRSAEIGKDQPFVGQIDLIAAITKWLGKRYGIDELVPRKFNAIIEGANVIVEALNSQDRPVKPGMGLDAWDVCDFTGLSSRYMASVLAPLAYKRAVYSDPKNGKPWPHDGHDFGRCVGLLDAAPELRFHLHAMAECGPQWKAIVGQWDQLESMLCECDYTGKWEALHKRLKELTEVACV